MTSLELCGGGVADLGCAHLATLSNLTSLNLSQNESITNRGAACLAVLTNLKALNLSNTCVNSDALKFFSGLLKLQSLALYGCNGIDGSDRLDSLQMGLPSLRCIRLNNASNEDGVIDADVGSDEDDDDVYYEEVDDEEEDQLEDTSGLEDVYHQLDEDNEVGENSVDSSEDGMSAFEDANETASQNENMDYEI